MWLALALAVYQLNMYVLFILLIFFRSFCCLYLVGKTLTFSPTFLLSTSNLFSFQTKFCVHMICVCVFVCVHGIKVANTSIRSIGKLSLCCARCLWARELTLYAACIYVWFSFWFAACSVLFILFRLCVTIEMSFYFLNAGMWKWRLLI